MWRELAETFAEYLDNTPRGQRSATMMGVIRQFLKDNACAANAAHQVDSSRRLSSLLNLGLPFGQSGKDH
jgi:hypothetical protein